MHPNVYFKFIDKYLCNILHNPILISICLLSSSTIIHFNQLNHYDKDQIASQEYRADFFSQIINLIFLVRVNATEISSLGLEIVLFVMQNFGCVFLLINKKYSFIYNDSLSLPLKACFLAQIIFPYLILLLHTFEWVLQKVTGISISEEDQKRELKMTVNLGHRTKTMQLSKFESYIFESNNNYLPIFISHSFLLINTNFIYSNSSFIERNSILIYTISQFSLKFYCIYRFILFEISGLLYNLRTNDYSQFYETSDTIIPSYNKESDSFVVSPTRVKSRELFKNLKIPMLQFTIVYLLLVDWYYS